MSRAQRTSDAPCRVHRYDGTQAEYERAHYDVAKLRGLPKLCEACGTTEARFFDWANITGQYDDPNDYARLCRACHREYDVIDARTR